MYIYIPVCIYIYVYYIIYVYIIVHEVCYERQPWQLWVYAWRSAPETFRKWPSGLAVSLHLARKLTNVVLDIQNAQNNGRFGHFGKSRMAQNLYHVPLVYVLLGSRYRLERTPVQEAGRTPQASGEGTEPARQPKMQIVAGEFTAHQGGW